MTTEKNLADVRLIRTDPVTNDLLAEACATQIEDPLHIDFVQFGFRIIETLHTRAVHFLVCAVFLDRPPSKIHETIVVANPIEVTGLLAFRARPCEGQQHQ